MRTKNRSVRYTGRGPRQAVPTPHVAAPVASRQHVRFPHHPEPSLSEGQATRTTTTPPATWQRHVGQDQATPSPRTQQSRQPHLAKNLPIYPSPAHVAAWRVVSRTVGPAVPPPRPPTHHTCSRTLGADRVAPAPSPNRLLRGAGRAGTQLRAHPHNHIAHTMTSLRGSSPSQERATA